MFQRYRIFLVALVFVVSIGLAYKKLYGCQRQKIWDDLQSEIMTTRKELVAMMLEKAALNEQEWQQQEKIITEQEVAQMKAEAEDYYKAGLYLDAPSNLVEYLQHYAHRREMPSPTLLQATPKAWEGRHATASAGIVPQYILLSPSFFELEPSVQKLLLLHEAAHCFTHDTERDSALGFMLRKYNLRDNPIALRYERAIELRADIDSLVHAPDFLKPEDYDLLLRFKRGLMRDPHYQAELERRGSIIKQLRDCRF